MKTLADKFRIAGTLLFVTEMLENENDIRTQAYSEITKVLHSIVEDLKALPEFGAWTEIGLSLTDIEIPNSNEFWRSHWAELITEQLDKVAQLDTEEAR